MPTISLQPYKNITPLTLTGPARYIAASPLTGTTQPEKFTSQYQTMSPKPSNKINTITRHTTFPVSHQTYQIWCKKTESSMQLQHQQSLSLTNRARNSSNKCVKNSHPLAGPSTPLCCVPLLPLHRNPPSQPRTLWTKHCNSLTICFPRRCRNYLPSQ